MQSQFAHRNGQDHSARHPIHHRDHSAKSVSAVVIQRACA